MYHNNPYTNSDFRNGARERHDPLSPKCDKCPDQRSLNTVYCPHCNRLITENNHDQK
jgi:hypothetical protein